MNQTIAKIDFEVNSESRLNHSVGEEDSSNQEANPPETVSAAEREAHYHNSKQKASSVIQLDHSFYEVHGEVENLKVLTFVQTVTSISGAVIVSNLSTSQVAIKALKKFIVAVKWIHQVCSSTR